MEHVITIEDVQQVVSNLDCEGTFDQHVLNESYSQNVAHHSQKNGFYPDRHSQDIYSSNEPVVYLTSCHDDIHEYEQNTQEHNDIWFQHQQHQSEATLYAGNLPSNQQQDWNVVLEQYEWLLSCSNIPPQAAISFVTEKTSLFPFTGLSRLPPTHRAITAEINRTIHHALWRIRYRKHATHISPKLLKHAPSHPGQESKRTVGLKRTPSAELHVIEQPPADEPFSGQQRRFQPYLKKSSSLSSLANRRSSSPICVSEHDVNSNIVSWTALAASKMDMQDIHKAACKSGAVFLQHLTSSHTSEWVEIALQALIRFGTTSTVINTREMDGEGTEGLKEEGDERVESEASLRETSYLANPSGRIKCHVALKRLSVDESDDLVGSEYCNDGTEAISNSSFCHWWTQNDKRPVVHPFSNARDRVQALVKHFRKNKKIPHRTWARNFAFLEKNVLDHMDGRPVANLAQLALQQAAVAVEFPVHTYFCADAFETQDHYESWRCNEIKRLKRLQRYAQQNKTATYICNELLSSHKTISARDYESVKLSHEHFQYIVAVIISYELSQSLYVPNSILYSGKMTDYALSLLTEIRLVHGFDELHMFIAILHTLVNLYCDAPGWYILITSCIMHIIRLTCSADAMTVKQLCTLLSSARQNGKAPLVKQHKQQNSVSSHQPCHRKDMKPRVGVSCRSPGVDAVPEATGVEHQLPENVCDEDDKNDENTEKYQGEMGHKGNNICSNHLETSNVVGQDKPQMRNHNGKNEHRTGYFVHNSNFLVADYTNLSFETYRDSTLDLKQESCASQPTIGSEFKFNSHNLQPRQIGGSHDVIQQPFNGETQRKKQIKSSQNFEHQRSERRISPLVSNCATVPSSSTLASTNTHDRPTLFPTCNADEELSHSPDLSVLFSQRHKFESSDNSEHRRSASPAYRHKSNEPGQMPSRIGGIFSHIPYTSSEALSSSSTCTPIRSEGVEDGFEELKSLLNLFPRSGLEEVSELKRHLIKPERNLLATVCDSLSAHIIESICDMHIIFTPSRRRLWPMFWGMVVALHTLLHGCSISTRFFRADLAQMAQDLQKRGFEKRFASLQQCYFPADSKRTTPGAIQDMIYHCLQDMFSVSSWVTDIHFICKRSVRQLMTEVYFCQLSSCLTCACSHALKQLQHEMAVDVIDSEMLSCVAAYRQFHLKIMPLLPCTHTFSCPPLKSLITYWITLLTTEMEFFVAKGIFKETFSPLLVNSVVLNQLSSSKEADGSIMTDIIPSLAVLSSALSSHLRFGIFLCALTSNEPCDPFYIGGEMGPDSIISSKSKHIRSFKTSPTPSPSLFSSMAEASIPDIKQNSSVPANKVLCKHFLMLLDAAFGIVEHYAFALIAKDLRTVPTFVQEQLDNEFSDCYNILKHGTGIEEKLQMPHVSSSAQSSPVHAQRTKRAMKRELNSNDSEIPSSSINVDNLTNILSPNSSTSFKDRYFKSTQHQKCSLGNLDDTKGDQYKSEQPIDDGRSWPHKFEAEPQLNQNDLLKLFWDTIDAPLEPNLLPQKPSTDSFTILKAPSSQHENGGSFFVQDSRSTPLFFRNPHRISLEPSVSDRLFEADIKAHTEPVKNDENFDTAYQFENLTPIIQARAKPPPRYRYLSMYIAFCPSEIIQQHHRAQSTLSSSRPSSASSSNLKNCKVPTPNDFDSTVVTSAQLPTIATTTDTGYFSLGDSSRTTMSAVSIRSSLDVLRGKTSLDVRSPHHDSVNTAQIIEPTSIPNLGADTDQLSLFIHRNISLSYFHVIIFLSNIVLTTFPFNLVILFAPVGYMRCVYLTSLILKSLETLCRIYSSTSIYVPQL